MSASFTADLGGKVAAITGGSRGIGRAIAETYLAAGARVAINGRSQEKGDRALLEMDAGEQAIFIAGDVTNRDSVNHFIDATVAQFGRVDILVNNAGGSSGYAPIAQLTDEAWDQAQAWILNSCFWATRRALIDMEPRNWGRIINISSVEGRQASKATVAHYITHKHAMNGFTKACAFEYGPLGITSNAISPGGVETDMMMELGPQAAESMGLTYEEFKHSYAEEASIKRMTTLDDVSAMALLIASDAGSGINGAILPIDGGTSL